MNALDRLIVTTTLGDIDLLKLLHVILYGKTHSYKSIYSLTIDIQFSRFDPFSYSYTIYIQFVRETVYRGDQCWAWIELFSHTLGIGILLMLLFHPFFYPAPVVLPNFVGPDPVPDLWIF